ncbi:metal-dependent transcriptional regulator [Endomicrobium proavitum]|uniref:Transcriptional regulator MntR n=1 Tax=Endomicrobium proavitum TaxID=1408281 RepID=A0A0G3WI38_9BACT|nr:metal-dependent transcriptional regulator [Endomicrobium proavitum]AKL98356.1 DtxR family iron dependent repressor [Endomicrobium proavitum]
MANNNHNINKLSAALENYLETIAALKREKKYARIGDIAKALNVKASSVNVAINFLAENDLVIHEKYGYVDLTEKGEKIAQEVQAKHDTLFKFLNDLLFIEKGVAVEEACEIEHSVSAETIRRLEKLYLLLKEHLLVKPDDMENLRSYLENNS